MASEYSSQWSKDGLQLLLLQSQHDRLSQAESQQLEVLLVTTPLLTLFLKQNIVVMYYFVCILNVLAQAQVLARL